MEFYIIIPQGAKTHKEGWDWFEGSEFNCCGIRDQKNGQK